MPLADETNAIDQWYALAEKLGLTQKQKTFCDAYVGSAFCNATKAAEKAEYGDRSNYDNLRAAASEVLTKPNVKEYIRERLKAEQADPETIINRVQKRAEFDPSTILDDEGVYDHKKAVETGGIFFVKKVTQTQHGVSVEVVDSAAADALLLKVHGRIGSFDGNGADGGGKEAPQTDAQGNRRVVVEIEYYDPPKKVAEGEV